MPFSRAEATGYKPAATKHLPVLLDPCHLRKCNCSQQSMWTGISMDEISVDRSHCGTIQLLGARWRLCFLPEFLRRKEQVHAPKLEFPLSLLPRSTAHLRDQDSEMPTGFQTHYNLYGKLSLITQLINQTKRPTASNFFIFAHFLFGGHIWGHVLWKHEKHFGLQAGV